MKEYNRVLLKLSGEALVGERKKGFDDTICINVAKQVKTLVDNGTQVGIVIGGGNFWRGRNSGAIDRTKADQIGMLATVMTVSMCRKYSDTSELKQRYIHHFHAVV